MHSAMAPGGGCCYLQTLVLQISVYLALCLSRAWATHVFAWMLQAAPRSASDSSCSPTNSKRAS